MCKFQIGGNFFIKRTGGVEETVTYLQLMTLQLTASVANASVAPLGSSCDYDDEDEDDDDDDEQEDDDDADGGGGGGDDDNDDCFFFNSMFIYRSPCVDHQDLIHILCAGHPSPPPNSVLLRSFKSYLSSCAKTQVRIHS